MLLPQFARDTSFVERFRREAQAAARLNQPNIVGVYDTGADDDTQFIVMEFIEGRTLEEFMSSGGSSPPLPKPPRSRRRSAARSRTRTSPGVIHRDIKPGNVMVTREGKVKVMDFGIARIVRARDGAADVSGARHRVVPVAGAGAGPARRRDAPTSTRSAPCCTRCSPGKPPFTGDSPVAVAYKQVNETPVVPSSLNPDVPPRLDAVVMKALVEEPVEPLPDRRRVLRPTWSARVIGGRTCERRR